MHTRRRARSSFIPPAAVLFRMLSFTFMLGVIGITIYRTAPWRQPQGAPPIAFAGAPEDRQEIDRSASALPAAAKDAPADAAEPSDAAEAALLLKGADSATEQSNEETVSSDTDSAADARVEAAADQAANEPADDRDPEQKAAFRAESQRILDETTLIQKFELPAYRRLFHWIASQSVEELEARSPPDAIFQQLLQHPDANRGKLVTIELVVRRVERDPESKDNPVGMDHVYQLWGWPTTGRGWLYDVVTPELPPGFPEGPDIQQTVRVYGYFFKNQGYYPGKAKPNGRMQLAPVIVGKLVWNPTVRTANPAEAALSYIVLAVGGAIVLSVIGYWFIAARQKKAARARRANRWTSAPTATSEPSDEPTWSDDAENESWEEPRRENFDWLRDP